MVLIIGLFVKGFTKSYRIIIRKLYNPISIAKQLPHNITALSIFEIQMPCEIACPDLDSALSI